MRSSTSFYFVAALIACLSRAELSLDEFHAKLDENHNGEITAEELITLMFHRNEDMIDNNRKAFVEADKDGDNVLSHDEYHARMIAGHEGTPKERPRHDTLESFEAQDADKVGTLDLVRSCVFLMPNCYLLVAGR